MSERSILITGCSWGILLVGIGLASAREMKARGWRVFVTARKPEDLARLRDEVAVESLYLDYAEPASIAEAAKHVLAATEGKLTAPFNNGGYGQLGAVEDLTPDVLRAQFEANVFGWHDLNRRVIPSMRARGEGRIVLLLDAGPGRGALSRRLLRLQIRHRGARRHAPHGAGGNRHQDRADRVGPIASRFLEHALQAYRRNIDLEGSPHREIYRARIARIEAGGSQTFKLGLEAVAAKLVKALESRTPKPRCYITVPTYVAAFLRRPLPTRALDAIAGSN
jgi:NAD(P)-dependent dehydrogenase (short-subunit alcohol dehydrogenase family)